MVTARRDGKSRGPGPAGGQYFSAAPTVASAPTTVALVLPDVRLQLQTDHGVFARGGVDAGTKYLLLEAPMPPADRPATVVDLGCGYGPIALTLAARCPRATVWAVDVNSRARELCARNADLAGLDNVRVCHPDHVVDGLAIDYLFTNPPIRIGKAQLHDLLRTWLERLAPGGTAMLVVHKHLGSDSLAAWLAGQGWPVERSGSRLGYRLLAVGAAS